MRRLLKTAALAAALIVVCAGAHAATFVNARRLVVALDLHTQLDAAIAQAIAQAKQQLYASGAPAQQVERLIAALEAEMQASAPELIAEITQIYANTFTDPEINQLVTFFESPVGKKLAAAQLDLAAAQLAATEQWLLGVAQRAQRRIDEFVPTV